MDGDVIASEVSTPYPGLLHADSKAVMSAYDKHGALTNATLYVALEPCQMCVSIAYWGGIRKIVYIISRSDLKDEYYGSSHNITDMVSKFYENIEAVKVEKLKPEILKIIKTWEDKNF